MLPSSTAATRLTGGLTGCFLRLQQIQPSKNHLHENRIEVFLHLLWVDYYYYFLARFVLFFPPSGVPADKELMQFFFFQDKLLRISTALLGRVWPIAHSRSPVLPEC